MRSITMGIAAKGRNELRKHLNGGRLTFKQAVLAKCYTCMGFYCDGKSDCAIPECPLYPFMPYASKKTSTALAIPKNGLSGI
jgi:hypothetical protein